MKVYDELMNEVHDPLHVSRKVARRTTPALEKMKEKLRKQLAAKRAEKERSKNPSLTASSMGEQAELIRNIIERVPDAVTEISKGYIKAAAKAARGKSERKINWRAHNVVGGKARGEEDVAHSIGMHHGRVEMLDKHLKKLLSRHSERERRREK